MRIVWINRQHTENLVDWLSALHSQAPSAEAQSAWSVYLPGKKSLEAELKR